MKSIYYYVYILECSDHSYYTGVTNNLDRRFTEHQAGNNTKCYTFKRRPVQLVYAAHFIDIHHAIEREKQIKRWSRKKKRALIAENMDSLKEFASCQNKSSHLNLDKL